jgi:beta-galactosidase
MKKSGICLIFLVSFIFNCRCQEKRVTIPLNGVWKIEEGSMDKKPETYTHTVQVPGLVSLAVPAFRDAGPKVKDRRSIIQKDTLREAFWYCRKFNLDNPVPDIALLKVSKAMFGTRVFLNGKDVGEHLPCFTPGYFDVKNALKKGMNELVIRVGSCRNSVPYSIPDGFDFEKDRYIPGIFDNVELILCGTPYISSAQTAPDIKNKRVRVQVKLEHPGNINTTKVTFVITEAKSQKVAGRVVKDFSFPPESTGEKLVDVLIPVNNCRFWSPEDPFLYNLKVTTGGDAYKTRFGMREFRYDTISGKTMLNGKQYFLRGTNITLYRFFEDSACKDLPWNNDWVRKLHQSFRQFHWNGMRYCIGLAPEEWYRIADEEGFLIQNEFPIWYGGKGWNVWPEDLKSDELIREYTEWMQEQWNHPSVVIWDASNETASHNGKTEEIADAVKVVRQLDLSNRPWDNSYSDIRAPGDVMELHPYHFQKSGYKLRDNAKADINPGGKPGVTKFMKIINEYGWLWLNRDGSPTTLTRDLYKNLLGENSTTEQRRHLYASYLAAETEFWRCHRQCAAVLHFTSLAYSRVDGQTSDHFTDIRNLKYEPEFLKHMPDAFSPVGLMLDEWGTEIECGVTHDFRIIAINDLEQGWKGKVLLQISINDKIVSEQSKDIVIPPYGQNILTISLVTPKSPGNYSVVASLSDKNKKPVRSTREISFIKSSRLNDNK